jgi:hypothetical protein
MSADNCKVTDFPVMCCTGQMSQVIDGVVRWSG